MAMYSMKCLSSEYTLDVEFLLLSFAVRGAAWLGMSPKPSLNYGTHLNFRCLRLHGVIWVLRR